MFLEVHSSGGRGENLAVCRHQRLQTNKIISHLTVVYSNVYALIAAIEQSMTNIQGVGFYLGRILDLPMPRTRL